jgi:hypothetical protein
MKMTPEIEEAYLLLNIYHKRFRRLIDKSYDEMKALNFPEGYKNDML